MCCSNYAEYTDGLKRVDTVTSGNKNMVTSGAVYSAIGGKKLKYKDVIFTIADMSFNHIQAGGRDFYYLNLSRGTWFNEGDIILSAQVCRYSGVSPLHTWLDYLGAQLAFVIDVNNFHFTDEANFTVRYLYLES